MNHKEIARLQSRFNKKGNTIPVWARKKQSELNRKNK